MRPDWTSNGDEEGRKPRPNHEAENELPIIDPEDGADYDDDEEEGLEDDELLEMDVEGEPRIVLITGACGNIGRKLRAAWEDVYDLILIDAHPDDSEEDEEVFQADLSQLDEEWITHFHGVDTVIHLAANPNESAPLEELIDANVDAMVNVFNAAALAGVDRLIFASSNHVMGGYQGASDEPITVELPPRPGNLYGTFKLVGERLGKSLSQAFDLTFIALRIGWVKEGANRADSITDDWGKKMWLSNHDLISLFEAAIEAEIEDRTFVVVNGVSRNHGTRWDLSDAAEILGYLPEDDAFAPSRRTETVDDIT
jgi:nucleoside-diphosphate-sugar epimerase